MRLQMGKLQVRESKLLTEKSLFLDKKFFLNLKRFAIPQNGHKVSNN